MRPPPAIASARHGYAKELLRQQFRAIHGGDNPPDWIVHTTFVPEVQDAAEAAVRDGLKRVGVKGLEAALVAMDPATGNLLALVGGSNYATDAVQPRHPQPPPARLGVQAVRLRGGAGTAACRPCRS